LLTGEYAWRKPGTGIATGDAGLLISTNRATLASMLRKAGYTTGVIGKWHLGLGPGPQKIDWNKEIVPGPREIGFDYSFLIPATGDRTPCVFVENQSVVGLDPADPIKVSYWLAGPNYPGELDGRANRDQLKLDWDFGHHFAVINGIGRIGYMKGGQKARWVDEDIADTLASKGASFIERNKDRPFFLYFATHDIHVPRVPHPRFVGKTTMGARGDAIVQFDFQVGAILEALDKYGLTEETLVILSSDNGPFLNDGYKDFAVEKLGIHRPAGEWRGHKYSAYEAGTRVPYLVRWPKQVKAGGISQSLICLIDSYASFASLVGEKLALEEAPDSFDVSAALLQPEAKGRESLILQDPGLSLRVNNWKYIPPKKAQKAPAGTLSGRVGNPDAFLKEGVDNGASKVPQLYDLSVDARECNNLAGAHPEKVKEFQAFLDKAREAGRTR
jgi:arylsulfatase A-like enzyme